MIAEIFTVPECMAITCHRYVFSSSKTNAIWHTTIHAPSVREAGQALARIKKLTKITVYVWSPTDRVNGYITVKR